MTTPPNQPAYSRPGVCGICGSAVVQPEHKEAGWHSGHYYLHRNNQVTLIKVRCMNHLDPDDPRHFDKDGNVTSVWPNDGWD